MACKSSLTWADRPTSAWRSLCEPNPANPYASKFLLNGIVATTPPWAKDWSASWLEFKPEIALEEIYLPETLFTPAKSATREFFPNEYNTLNSLVEPLYRLEYSPAGSTLV